MRSSDILEIRKRFKDETGSIRKIAIAYCAGSDKSVLCRSVRTFNALEEAERLRYLEIFRKGFSGAKDRNILSLPFELDSKMESDVQKDLITLRNSEFKDEAAVNAFMDRIIECYKPESNFLIILISDAYDIPDKGEDNLRQGESGEVYDYIACFICPVNLAKVALSYHEDDKMIASRIRDHIVDMPEVGFVFPAFSERSADVNNVMYYVKDPKEGMHPELINDLLKCTEVTTSIQEKEVFNQIVEDVISEVPEYDTFDVVKNINTKLCEMVEESGYNEPPVIDKPMMKKLMADSGIKEEHMEIVDDYFDRIAGDIPIHSENVAEKRSLKVKADDVKLDVKPESADKVEIRIIDGRKYLVIPMDSDIEVNGIIRRINETLKEE